MHVKMTLHYEALYTDLIMITMKSVLLPSRKIKPQVLPVFVLSEAYVSTTKMTSLHFWPEKYLREFFFQNWKRSPPFALLEKSLLAKCHPIVLPLLPQPAQDTMVTNTGSCCS